MTSSRRPGVAMAIAAALVALAAPVLAPQRPAAASDPVLATLCLGAASVEPGNACLQATDGPTIPAAADARLDRSQSYQHRCQVHPDFTDRYTCEFGDLSAHRNVALVGNSHAVQWLPALHEIGLRRGFKITTYISAMCFVTTVRIAWRGEDLRQNCHDWGQWVRESTAYGDYDLIVQTERTYRWPDGPFTGPADDEFERGYREHLATWAAAGRTVLVLRDTPMPAHDVPTCLLRHPDDYGACSTPRADALQRDPLVDAAESFLSERIRVADLTHYYCPGESCPAVIGREVVYFDASHVTATYARSVAPYLDDHVVRALRVDAAAREAAAMGEPPATGGPDD